MKRSDRVVAAVLGTVLAGYTVLLAHAELISSRGVSHFTRDASYVLDGPWHTGYLSTLGVLTWWSGAACAVFAGLALLRRDRRVAAMLLAAGGLTAVLALDDAMSLHEDALVNRVGIPQTVTVGLYGLAAVALLVGFRREIAKGPWWVLAFGVTMLFGSALADQLGDMSERLYRAGVEDTLKLFGVAAWSLFWCTTSLAAVSAAITAPAPVRADGPED